MSMFSGDAIGVDFGTSHIAIYLPGEGVVLREASSVLALKNDAQQVISLGNEAHQMQGRTAEETMLYAPVLDGAVTDPDIAALLLLALTERVTGRRKPLEKPRLYLNMPYGLTKVERAALEQTARLAGSKKTTFVKAPVAAALGVGLPLDEPKGTMVIVLGAGITEIAVLSMHGIVAARSIRSGSLSMDEAIVRYVRKKKGLVIGPRTAEDIKCDIGSADLPDYDSDEENELEFDEPEEMPGEQSQLVVVADEATKDEESDKEETTEEAHGPHQGEKVLLKGRDAKTGLPKTVEITTRDIALALREPIRLLVDVLRDALQRTPEELSADVLDQGIHLSGGGALLYGLAEVLQNNTGVPVHVSEHPQDDILLGLGRLMDDDYLYKACLEQRSLEG